MLHNPANKRRIKRGGPIQATNNISEYRPRRIMPADTKRMQISVRCNCSQPRPEY